MRIAQEEIFGPVLCIIPYKRSRRYINSKSMQAEFASMDFHTIPKRRLEVLNNPALAMNMTNLVWKNILNQRQFYNDV
jgi:hypothetical protein